MTDTRHMGKRELKYDASRAEQAFTWYVSGRDWHDAVEQLATVHYKVRGSRHMPLLQPVSWVLTSPARLWTDTPVAAHERPWCSRRAGVTPVLLRPSTVLWYHAPATVTVAAGEVGKSIVQCSPLPYTLPPLPHLVSYSCLSASTWQAKRVLTWLDNFGM